MGINTRGKVRLSRDKNSYLEYDEGTGKVTMTVDGVAVGTFHSTTGFASLVAMASTGALAVGAAGVTPISGPVGSGVMKTWQPSVATSGTDTAFASGTQFVGGLWVPANCTLTGIGYLIGSVGGTDKVYAVLYDSTGDVLANSVLTAGGATVGTAANVQTLDFTAPFAVKGPGLFYVGISANGATAKLCTVPAHCQGGIYAGSVAQVHGTVAAITAPVTFTADKAPVAYAY